jgi:hypothetical protein
MPFIETQLFELGIRDVSPQRWRFSSEVTS